MEATALIPQVKFFISGKVPRDVLTLKSTPNTVFLGYLPSSEYYTYLANARLVLTLSTRSWIMQMAVEEALLYGVPVVTNHSPVIESVASCGGKFVSLSAPEVARGINEALEQHDDLLLGIRADRARLLSAMADKYKNFDF
jgi:glycosyltransferase involved in cell wall biosynthesis